MTGHGHFRTFDGVHYLFPENCEYILAEVTAVIFVPCSALFSNFFPFLRLLRLLSGCNSLLVNFN